jgi:hypothetical protein
MNLGTAGIGWYRVPRDAREIRLVPGSSMNWSVEPVRTSVRLDARSDTLSMRLDFPYYYRFDSAPFGATVSVMTGAGEIRDVGTTPVIYTSTAPLARTVQFNLDGYTPAEISPGTDVWNRHFVELRRIGDTAGSPPDADYHPPSGRKWIDVAAVTTAIAGGILAVHYKFKADRLFDQYQETGDPALRQQIQQYDVYSGVALGAMQVGVGVFVVRLILR